MSGSHKDSDKFWETVALDDMSDQQWESLCDGCGRCCLQKLQDSDTGNVYFTDIACELLNLNTCRCSDYPNRQSRVPDCTMVRPLTDEKRKWLPDTCAYRRLDAGLTLLPWHPLITGTTQSVQAAGISITGVAIAETDVAIDDYQEHVIHF